MKNNEKEIVEQFTHYDYMVETRSCADCFRPEKLCNSEKEAIAYIEEYGERDYKGQYHGHEMRAVEVARTTTKRLLKTNRG